MVCVRSVHIPYWLEREPGQYPMNYIEHPGSSLKLIWYVQVILMKELCFTTWSVHCTCMSWFIKCLINTLMKEPCFTKLFYILIQFADQYKCVICFSVTAMFCHWDWLPVYVVDLSMKWYDYSTPKFSTHTQYMV